jgi:hypothetical protein
MATPYSFHVSLIEFPHTVEGAINETFYVDKDKFFELEKANRGSWGILPMLVCVIRTDTLENFATDLFLPTFINCALKVHQFAGKITAGIFFFIVDIATLPLRMITLLPRVIISLLYTKENHPGYQFLQKHSANPEVYRNVNRIYIIGREPNKETPHLYRTSSNQYFFSPVPKATLGDYCHDLFVLI